MLKKGKVEGKITYDELLTALPHAEDDVDKLDDIYTRLMKLNIEIIDSFKIPPEIIIKGEKYKEEARIKEVEKEEEEYKEEQKETLEEILKKIEHEQKTANLKNITKFNDEIHKKIL